mgnify:CR=1 FL=1
MYDYSWDLPAGCSVYLLKAKCWIKYLGGDNLFPPIFLKYIYDNIDYFDFFLDTNKSGLPVY